MGQKKGHQKGSPQSKNISLNNNLSEHEIIDKFRTAMLSEGITPPDRIIADGLLHRFSTNGKTRDKAGWYELKLDNLPAGSFGDFRQCPKVTWNAGGSGGPVMNAVELAENRKRVAEQMEEDRQRLAEKHEKVSIESKRIYKKGFSTEPCHRYLVNKGVKPFNSRQIGPQIIIPLHDVEGKQWTHQTISGDGKKMLFRGGKKRGCFCLVNARLSDLEESSMIYMVEGWATGASVAECYPDVPVVVAIDSGNLCHVIEAIRTRWPYLSITIYADNDRKAESEGYKNIGVESAKAAASQFLNVFVEIPNFPESAPIELSDFNDLIQWRKSQNGGEL